MTKLQKYIYVDLTEEQKDAIQGLLYIINQDALNYPDGKSRKGIIAQIMNNKDGDVYLAAAVITEEMVIKIREATGAE